MKNQKKLEGCEGWLLDNESKNKILFSIDAENIWLQMKGKSLNEIENILTELKLMTDIRCKV